MIIHWFPGQELLLLQPRHVPARAAQPFVNRSTAEAAVCAGYPQSLASADHGHREAGLQARPAFGNDSDQFD